MVGVRRTVPKAFGSRAGGRRHYAGGLWLGPRRRLRPEAVVAADPDEALAMLWRQYRRGDEA